MGHVYLEIILFLLFFLPNLSFYLGITDSLTSNLLKFIISLHVLKKSKLRFSSKGFLLGLLSCVLLLPNTIDLFLIPILLLASFSEELIFRVEFQQRYGVLSSSLLFLLWHIPKLLVEPFYVFPSILIMSLFWGLIYEKTNDFSLVFSSHFFYDLFLSSGGGGPIWLSLSLVFIYIFKFW